MVNGLERFRKHFAPYTDQYILIGGTACTVIMQEAGLDFRATKDLDIVLYSSSDLVIKCSELIDFIF